MESVKDAVIVVVAVVDRVFTARNQCYDPIGVRPDEQGVSRGVPYLSAVDVDTGSNHMLKHVLGKDNWAYLFKNQASAVRLQLGLNPSLHPNRTGR